MLALADKLIGTDVGRYRLVRVLGEGGMGRVYEGVQPEIGSRVAIKVIAERHANDPELTERFFAEARAVNLIRHENIVGVLDLVRLADGRPVIIMELVEGRTLREAIAAGPAPLRAVLDLVVEVLGALAAAHAIGIVHRDLKPDNILITPGGHAKVLDFGIAKLVQPTEGQRTPRTRTGMMLGTPEYMAPEQIHGASADARLDIYAMGVVLFEALTARRPFEGASDFEILRAHVEQAPPAASSLRADVPVDLDRAIDCALAKAPEHRFANATAFANALRSIAQGLPIAAWPAAAAPPSRPLTAVPAPGRLDVATAEAGAREERETVSARARAGTVDSKQKATVAETPRHVSARRRRRWWLAVAAGLPLVAAAVIAIAVTRGTEQPGVAPHQDAAIATTTPPDAAVVVVTPAIDAAVVVAAPPDAAHAHHQTRVAAAPLDAAPGQPLQATGIIEWKDPHRAETHEVYNGHHVDPIAMLPKAEKIARQVAADAVLRSVQADGATANGFIDLDPALCCYAAAVRYDFHTSGDRCNIVVVLGESGYVSIWTDTDWCGVPKHARRCSVRQIWAKAKQDIGDVPPDFRAQVEWNVTNDGKWRFQPEDEHHGGSREYDDDCS